MSPRRRVEQLKFTVGLRLNWKVLEMFLINGLNKWSAYRAGA